MTSQSLLSPIAIRALENALLAARIPPKPRPKTDSRIADKFVVRGFDELLQELEAIGAHEGRSINSEVVAGILEALGGYERSNTLTRILKSNLGKTVSEQVLAQVQLFDISRCKVRRKFVIRFPAKIRETVREGVKNVAGIDDDIPQKSMNTWFLEAMVVWVNIQRTQYALLSAAIGHELVLAGPQSSQ
jgi:hypothetical protein